MSAEDPLSWFDSWGSSEVEGTAGPKGRPVQGWSLKALLGAGSVSAGEGGALGAAIAAGRVRPQGEQVLGIEDRTGSMR